MAARSDFGAEGLRKGGVVCEFCRMRFPDAPTLESHQTKFCDKRSLIQGKRANADDVAPAKALTSVSADDVKSYTSGTDKSAIGALTVGQLRQAMNATSMTDLQARVLADEKVAFAASIRSFKDSFGPPAGAGERERGGRHPPAASGYTPRDPVRRTPEKAGRSREGPSIASLLARHIMQDFGPPRSSQSPLGDRGSDGGADDRDRDRRRKHDKKDKRDKKDRKSKKERSRSRDMHSRSRSRSRGGKGREEGMGRSERGSDAARDELRPEGLARRLLFDERSGGDAGRREGQGPLKGGADSSGVFPPVSASPYSGARDHSASPYSGARDHSASPYSGARDHSASPYSGARDHREAILATSSERPGHARLPARGQRAREDSPDRQDRPRGELREHQDLRRPPQPSAHLQHQPHEERQQHAHAHTPAPSHPETSYIQQQPPSYVQHQRAHDQPQAQQSAPHQPFVSQHHDAAHGPPPWNSGHPYPSAYQQHHPNPYLHNPYSGTAQYPYPPYGGQQPYDAVAGQYAAYPHQQVDPYPYQQPDPYAAHPHQQSDPYAAYPHQQAYAPEPYLPAEPRASHRVREVDASESTDHVLSYETLLSQAYAQPGTPSEDQQPPKPGAQAREQGGSAPSERGSEARACSERDLRGGSGASAGRRMASEQSVAGGRGRGGGGDGTFREHDDDPEAGFAGGGVGVGVGAKRKIAVEDAVACLRNVGLGRRVPQEIKSREWYESVVQTHLDREDAAELQRDLAAAAAVVGMAVEHGYGMVDARQRNERLALTRKLVEVRNDLEEARMKRKRDEWLHGKRVGLKEALGLRALVPEGSAYDPISGFELSIDALAPTPPSTEAAVLLYGLFEGSGRLMPLQATPPSEAEFSFQAGARHARFAVRRDFLKLPPSRATALVVEVQEAVGELTTQAVAWTAVPIFYEDGNVVEGAWRVPLFKPPLQLGLPWSGYGSLPLAPGDPYLLLRLSANKPAEGEQGGGEEEEEEEELGDSDYHYMPHLELDTPRWVRAFYEPDPEPEEEEEEAADDSEKERAAEAKRRAEEEEEDARRAREETTHLHLVRQHIAEDAWVAVGPFGDEVLAACSAADFVLVVLDAARFLPDSVTVTRATLSLVDDSGEARTQQAIASTVAEVDSGVHSPRFKLSCMLQVVDLSPRTHLVVQIDAVDLYTLQTVTAGFATSALLLHPTSNRTPTAEQATAYEGELRAHLESLRPPEGQRQKEILERGFRPPPVLRVRTGGQQLCVRQPPATYDSRAPHALSHNPRLPCCTVLVRVYVNPTEEQARQAVEDAGINAVLEDLRDEAEGRDGDKPEAERLMLRIARKICDNKPLYSDGRYDSSSCVPSGAEIATYNVRMLQFKRDVSVRDIMSKLLPTGEYDAARRSDAAAREAARRLLSFGDKGRLPPIDLTFFCTYNASVGFKVSVDGANNLPGVRKGHVPICLMGVSPPCSYFGPERMLGDVHVNRGVVLESTPRFPRWAEGFRSIRNVPFRGTVGGLIILVGSVPYDVSKAQVEDKVTPIGWTVVPLFLGDTLPYLVDGSFLLPLYKGDVPRHLSKHVDEMGVEEGLRWEEVKGKAKLLNSASVIVRLVDLQRGLTSHPAAPGIAEDDHLRLPPDCSELMLRSWLSGRERLNEFKSAKYFKVHKGIFEGKLKPVSSLLRKGETESQFYEFLTDQTTSLTGIQTIELSVK